MKKNLTISLLTIALLSISCAKERKVVSKTIVEPTCFSEGYTEYRCDDGYVYRDSFTSPISHSYQDVEIGGEEGVVYEVCEHCGHLKIEYDTSEISTEVVINPDRVRPSFVDHKVLACSMILERTPDDAIRAMRKAEKHGAHAFMVYVTALDQVYWTLHDFQRVFQCVDEPVLSIAYSVSTYEPRNLSYVEMENLLRLSVEAGASAIDYQAFTHSELGTNSTSEHSTYRASWEEKGLDMSFVDASPKEINLNPTVLARQKTFIEEIQGMGASVLYSCHAGVEMNSTQAVALAKYMQYQGIDVAKIVLGGSSKESVIEHLKAIKICSDEMDIKFSIHGQSTLSRLMGPMFGSYIAFCVDTYTEKETNIQIDLATMIAILESPELSGNA